MKVKNIASGSSGNVTLVESNNINILIDCGISCKKINEGLKEEGLSLSNIDGILITHEHTDHINGLGVIERKYHIPVYATGGTIRGIRAASALGEFDTGLLNEISAGRRFTLGDMDIEAYNTYHDANEPVCYRVEAGRSSFAVVTDLGQYEEGLVDFLGGLDGILLEANHDIRMLEVGPYPYHLKQRILGKFGHLSNESSGRLLAQLLHDNIKYIMLGHLSRENNTRELAKLAVETEIALADNIYKPGDFDILVAHRDRPSDTAIL